jgi:hypothetical protein
LSNYDNFGISELIDSRLDDYQNLASILDYAGAGPGAKQVLEMRSSKQI